MQTVLLVNDLTASLAFYRDVLQFVARAPEEGTARGPGAGAAAQGSGADAVAMMAGLRAVAQVVGPGGISILLAERGADLSPWAGVPVSGPGAWVYLHRPDVLELAAAVGGEAIVPYPGFRHLQITDPDGYVVTFWESQPVPDEEILAIYRLVPARLKTALSGLDNTGLDLEWAPGKWTIRQIVHHIVDSDLGTFQVIRSALAFPGREISTNPWPAGRWMDAMQCAERSVDPAMALFAASHAWVTEAIGVLPDALDRWVTWPSGYRADVRQLLRQVGGHALHHILQIEETGRRCVTFGRSPHGLHSLLQTHAKGE